MFEKIRTFFSNFFCALQQAYNKAFKEIPKGHTQEYGDTKRINFLFIFVSKLNNLANVEATFSVEAQSSQADRLVNLCHDLEDNRFEFTSEMLGRGDLWCFPAHDSNGELYHAYVTQDKVRILDVNGKNVTDIIGIVDEYIDKENRTYFLNRRQTLNGDTLTIETYTTNERNERVELEEWADLEGVYRISGAKSIGVGRFKSPASSRGKSPVYGVPINFACEEIEDKIFADMKMIEEEFANAKSKIFADPFVLKKGKDKVGSETWKIPENVFPIDTRGGQTSANIDIFSPTIRYSEYRSKLMDDLSQYEQQVGTDKGFLTPFESVSATTATEIKRANASTIALIDKIHAAIKRGVKETIDADAMFLGIPDHLYNVIIDFYDIFTDEETQYQRISNAVDRGVAEKSDEIRWLFPNLTSDEISEKLARIEESQTAKTDSAIDRILQNG